MQAINFFHMKKLMILIVALTLSVGAFAQEKMNHKMDSKMDMKTDHFMMEGGKMMMIKNGETMSMDKDMTLRNGTVVKMDGTVKKKNGKSMKLKDGQMIYVNGKMSGMGKMKMDKSMPMPNKTP